MADLLLHPQSEILLGRYMDEPSHAVLLTGEIGVGLMTAAMHAASKITDPAHVTVVLPDEGKTAISIASVRELYAMTKTKQAKAHVIILDNAELMDHSAQNALLKLLEEPTPEVFFILTSHSPQLLLATIRSRAQQIDIRPVPSKLSLAYARSLGVDDEKRLGQIMFIADGRPAEMNRLAHDEEYFARQSAKAIDARSFLGGAAYDRLILAGKYSSRDEALEFLGMLARFAIHTLHRQPDTYSARKLQAVDKAISRIAGNGNVRTQLTWLVTEWS